MRQDKHVIKLLFSHADGCSISLMEEIDYISILSVQLTLIGWFGKKNTILRKTLQYV